MRSPLWLFIVIALTNSNGDTVLVVIVLPPFGVTEA
jgi:hypothetical protein